MFTQTITKNDDKSRLVNGVTFDEIKRIRNAIYADNAELLSSSLTNIQDINYMFEVYNHNLFVVDWTSDVKMSMPTTFISLLHLAARLGRANCIQMLIDKNVELNAYSFTKSYLIDETTSGNTVQFRTTLNYIKTPIHEICCGIVDEKSDFSRSADILLSKGANMEARIYNNPVEQSAYDLCLDIKTAKTKTDSLFIFEEINDRTKSADFAKDAFIRYRDNKDKRLTA